MPDYKSMYTLLCKAVDDAIDPLSKIHEAVPVAQALITESEAPFALKRIATLPVAMFPIIIGMKNGETFFAPPFSIAIVFFSNV